MPHTCRPPMPAIEGDGWVCPVCGVEWYTEDTSVDGAPVVEWFSD